jgi:S1-C subfamily serine protease
MKKAFSYTAIFVTGFVACALTLRLYGDPIHSLLPGGSDQAKQAVLATLNSPPPQAHHFVGDSVVADAAAKLEPAIVSVHTVGKPVQTGMSGPFGDDPIFRRFFGGGQSAPVTPKGAGSGVIISSDGYILTNNHVVADTQTVTVNVGNKGYDAKVIGADPVTDIAVVKINPRGAVLHPAELGNSDDMRIGDWAIAVGNPLDIGETVTLGIVSGFHKKGDLAAEGHELGDVIQTDAAINPGNSGGALANINGQVIGINEAIYSPTGTYVGIGFAIPINAAKRIAAELIQNGKIVRPYLGVQYSALSILSPQDRQHLGIQSNLDHGAVVLQVFPGTPADKAGLQTYDVILEANRQRIVDKNDLDNIIQKQKIGNTLTLLVSRNGQNRIITVTLRERPANFGVEPSPETQAQPQMEIPFGP